MTPISSLRLLQEKLRGGEQTCAALVEEHLARIEAAAALNAFITILQERARRRAQEIDARLRLGTAGKLAGCLMAVKDILAMKGERLTCGSRMLANFVSPYDATVIARLEQADAIILGKTNMDEFAMGSSNENSAFGPVKNPVNPAHVPGGSSGGSAAAVAAGLVHAALGSDTGGSIRQPAAFTGVVGLKPTYGRVSRWGLVAFASSLDQAGPITTCVEDTARLLEVIAGVDERDSTSAPVPVPEYSAQLTGPIRGTTIGLPVEYLSEGVQPEITAAVARARQILAEGGAVLKEVSLPHTKYAIATYYVICTAEASSNLSRYDGARYGYRAPEAASLEELYVNSRSQGFGTEVKRRIMLGTYVLSAGYYEAYYRRAMKVRTLIRRDFEKAFQECDALLMPTTPTTAFRFGEKTADPLTMYLSDIFTVSMNLAGVPGISIPAGRDAAGLPIGLQLVAPAFEEARLLRLAYYLEGSGINESV
ncbi:MAG: Asp-tRNA(Asn)/Glu-tRNA(Gln) amidotransferase subunit GatA [candidate division KSB1 bacterium]|nr:Asp-tRNA(Asn)/Glu-tRNA(Gln) amidotransferase subunit GatA [candidate division KSB1 bacterium]MDZ7275075.1 Asp-tRNA(Asn)/Glu-tRNA(Gln) amidotransferase subunit GatA [candidate division KSB1 bacterium]MDZ7286477.1 Asp-tRNA(Asn)/Glu-tRNA(Gln) amidotransferase subunit GatA [candidate division KSB1 bacterium]MDZ7299359.1 Asp-tRNA(Asn)/Glu-tRNA(Gln) amidotransferase subunit GatA [candidate division KSB1 bacterium]MDZ7306312.1 Asp-tRNA(Asn)/Glu-tRNA(Gln) amidotransferase subunit GatA [candidate div